MSDTGEPALVVGHRVQQVRVLPLVPIKQHHGKFGEAVQGDGQVIAERFAVCCTGWRRLPRRPARALRIRRGRHRWVIDAQYMRKRGAQLAVTLLTYHEGSFVYML